MNEAPPGFPEASPPSLGHKTSRRRILALASILAIGCALALAAMFLFPRARDSKTQTSPPPAAPGPDESW